MEWDLSPAPHRNVTCEGELPIARDWVTRRPPGCRQWVTMGSHVLETMPQASRSAGSSLVLGIHFGRDLFRPDMLASSSQAQHFQAAAKELTVHFTDTFYKRRYQWESQRLQKVNVMVCNYGWKASLLPVYCLTQDTLAMKGLELESFIGKWKSLLLTSLLI